ncbi:hypothetical protein C9J85_11565 [Haloferax sp. wsp5]|nr:hypothetical protein C9J85_11565 [Haloferax sp. wsp5]
MSGTAPRRATRANTELGGLPDPGTSTRKRRIAVRCRATPDGASSCCYRPDRPRLLGPASVTAATVAPTPRRSPVADYVDDEDIGLEGHSMGGWTVITAAAALRTGRVDGHRGFLDGSTVPPKVLTRSRGTSPSCSASRRVRPVDVGDGECFRR